MKSLRQLYKRFMLTGDLILAVLVVAGAIGVALWACGSKDALLARLDGTRSPTYETIASISGSLLGFIIAAVSIIAAFGSLPRFDLLRRSSQYKEIFRVFYDAIHWLAAATMLSLCGLVLDTDKFPLWQLTVSALVVCAIMAVRVWRCTWIMHHITVVAATPIPETQQTAVQRPT